MGWGRDVWHAMIPVEVREQLVTFIHHLGSNSGYQPWQQAPFTH